MKTIRQLSDDMKISKEAIYKKIKHQLKDALNGHIVKVDNITQLDEIGERILFESLSLERQQAIQDTIELSNEVTPLDEPLSNPDPLNQPLLNELVNLLKEQVRLKDIQIDAQNSHITNLISQVGYGQMLLKTDVYKNLLLLQANVRANETVRNKPLWKKLLRK